MRCKRTGLKSGSFETGRVALKPALQRQSNTLQQLRGIEHRDAVAFGLSAEQLRSQYPAVFSGC